VTAEGGLRTGPNRGEGQIGQNTTGGAWIVTMHRSEGDGVDN